MVECEYDFNGLAKGVDRVLIDTWWNVNYMNIRSETGQYPGFNRYMVECEYVILDVLVIGEKRFNRYMVECE